MIDGHESVWESLVDAKDHVPDQNDTMESFDVADWQDKVKIHRIMNQVAAYAHRYCACPSWRID